MNRLSRRLVPFVVGGVVGLGGLAGLSSAGRLTTDPGKSLIVYVNISDHGIKLSSFLKGSLAGNSNLFVAEPARGEMAYFEVRNVGKKTHSFQVLGKKIPSLAPGEKKEFRVYLARRGRFPYRSTVDKHKAGFHGVFAVL